MSGWARLVQFGYKTYNKHESRPQLTVQVKIITGSLFAVAFCNTRYQYHKTYNEDSAITQLTST